MDAGAVIFARLNGATSAGSRVYPLILPEMPTYPAVTYQQVSAIPLHAMGTDAGMTRVRMQVDCWGQSYADATTLAGEVTAHLSRFRGTAGGVVVLDVMLDNAMTLYESDAQVRRVMQDWTVFLQE